MTGKSPILPPPPQLYETLALQMDENDDGRRVIA
jgi:hypothetical protein